MLSVEPDLFDWARREAEDAPPRARPCKICGAASAPFDVVDFNKSCDARLYPSGLCGVPVVYHRCPSCAFIFTGFFDGFTSDQWARHVYNADYVKVDPEYVDARPRTNARELQSFLPRKEGVLGLDFGGGNGLTAALMRDAGRAFQSLDPFGYSDVSPQNAGHFNFCSAMEVFEHTPDPVAALKSILGMCTGERLIVFIGTAVHDGVVTDATRLAWWYAAPRNGHISLFSRAALARLGADFGLDYASITRGTHLLTRGVSRWTARAMLLRGKVLVQAGRLQVSPRRTGQNMRW
jgi:2-polyprenyl-6-hydroxyphenyl methylase/3-demethylubiquinone-9 3-methyltransferase